MAGVTLNVSQRFAVGATVGAYPKSGWLFSELPPSGTPKGSATTTAVVAANGSVTFAGLADSTAYFAMLSTGVGGYVQFSTPSQASTSTAELRRRLWMPAIVQDETIFRGMCYTTSTPTSGVLRLCGGAVIRAGVPVSNITHYSNVALVTPTHQWFCLVRESDNAVLAKTTDDTNTAWGATAAKTLSFATPYVPTADAAVWLGIMVTAGTMPQLVAAVGAALGSLEPGPISCNADTGLTDPASLGATVTPGASANVSWAGWG